MTELQCSACQQTKPVDEFYRTSKFKLRDGKRSIRKRSARDYRASECRGCMGDRGRGWRERSPERVRFHRTNHARKDALGGVGTYRASIDRARKRGAHISLTLGEWKEVYFATSCHWCDCALHRSFTNVDHIVPLSEGGEHTRSNLVAACANCNMRRAWERKAKYFKEGS